ncbi:hypothetical protein DICPUDRAFT_79089 [Dictyostelium purpureum]|uniref:Uncharacterized protein n=1 Tax=Dictyostelium purpureum TaxID=5786 RepID=F0ZLI9_DICPU|nr:uncharacterized protein DICPUDRAFT_79089 [Dictyostelium purpureum]EGC35186.1 hypothetical protein DICPUDRAFT_79089 [Dictyostelium purpureum]|eukprot:XP_003288274.1 hypothetical protein DICPUDRAFT_79089 [Dictyostelium purpureum]
MNNHNLKFENVIDVDNSLYNNNIVINYFNVFYNKNQPYLIWPQESEHNNNNNSNNNDSFEYLNFLPIFSDCNSKIKHIKQKFIHFKCIENNNLLFTYSKFILTFYKFDSIKNNWEIIQTLNHNDLFPQLSYKSIIEYGIDTNVLVVYCATDKKLFLFKNVLDKPNIKLETIQIEELGINSSIVDIKWSNLILSICTSNEIIFLKWNSIQEIGNKNYQIYRFVYDQDSDFIKMLWIDNQTLLVSTHISIKTNLGSNSNAFEILKLPEKKSIQILDIINNEEKDKEEEILFLKPNSNNTSSIPSLFMINSLDNNKEDSNNSEGAQSHSKILDITSEIEMTTVSNKRNIDTDNSKSSILFLKFIDNEIKLINSIKINNEISTPDLLSFKMNGINNGGYIGVSSTLSNKVNIIKHSNFKLTDKKILELAEEKYKIKAIGFLNNNNNNDDIKIYSLVSEKLNSKGIGLSFKPKSNFKVSLYSYIVEKAIEIKQPQPQTPNGFLNFQNIIIEKLTSIENILNNHSKRLEKMENNIEQIQNQLNK